MSAQRRRKNQRRAIGQSAVTDVYVTFTNYREATRICATVVKERLAACANIWSIRSIYYWQQRIVRSREAAALLKTTESRYQELERRLKKLHRYDVPCIVRWTLAGGNRPYLDWIKRRTNARG